MKILLFIIILLPTSLSANEVDWVEIKNAFSDYVNEPNDISANKAIKSLPEVYTQLKSKESLSASEYIYNYNQFGMLERQVISSHQPSVRLAFRLRSFADGGFSEDISILLGQLIRINPTLFLSELVIAKPKVKSYGNFLNEGEIFVDRFTAQCHELALRREALKTVTNPNLQEAKNEFILIVTEALSASPCKQYNNALNRDRASRAAP